MFVRFWIKSRHTAMFALPPKAGIDRRDGNVRFVPIVLQKSPSRLC